MDQTTRSLPEDGQAAGRVPGPSRQGPTSAGKPASSARMQVYRSPHEAKSISGSNSRLIKGLSARIQLHCAPTHNWESRRKDLRDSVREQMANMGGTKCSAHVAGVSKDKVDQNIANAWVERIPCVAAHKRSREREAIQHKLCQVAQRREELRQQWIEAHNENKRRLARRREEKEAERCRETVMARKYFWLTMLWCSAAQELLAQSVVKARVKRAELENAHKQIVYIQSSIRMLLARRQFARMKEATLMIQKGVRRFLRMLYLRRRKEAAKLIIRCLQSMQHDSAIKKSFQKLIKSVQTLKAMLRRYCMVRDARIMILKTQWVKWETMHTRQPGKDAKRTKPGISFGAPTPTGGSSIENSFSLMPVQDSIKRIVCRQHCTTRAAEVIRKVKQREKRREQLLQSYEVDVILEKCWLLDIKPEDSMEYKNALKQIEEDLGAPPVLRTVETAAVISKLHRQGMRIQDKQHRQAHEGQSTEDGT